MGLFDLFKKKPESRPDKNDLYQICYRVAYYMYPALLYSDPQKMREIFTKYGDAAGAYFYVLLCKQEGIEPDEEHAKRFRPYTGQLANGTDYVLLEYPTPPPVNPDLMKAALAPHFSIILYPRASENVAYYILGQRPFGGTTLRTVTKDGMNANLGEGCEPDRDTFLAFLTDKLSNRGG
jgi:hypothetical protein